MPVESIGGHDHSDPREGESDSRRPGDPPSEQDQATNNSHSRNRSLQDGGANQEQVRKSVADRLGQSV